MKTQGSKFISILKVSCLGGKAISSNLLNEKNELGQWLPNFCGSDAVLNFQRTKEDMTKGLKVNFAKYGRDWVP